MAERNIYGIFIGAISFQRQAHQQYQWQRLSFSLRWNPSSLESWYLNEDLLEF